MANTAYILLGSNLGDPALQLSNAMHLIEQKAGRLIKKSSLYLTAAWGNTSQPAFMNQVIIINTDLSARSLLKILLQIEKEMGRVRTVKNAPRIIDLDILFYNNDIISHTNLSVPHPAMQKRRFVLVPLNELSPDFIHPVLKKNIQELLKECTDDLDVKRF